ncbi:MAG TPA: tyrosine-type recombinase/integrase [Gemmatimonadaceae bacterium]
MAPARPIGAENAALIHRYINFRGTRLSQNSMAAYQEDLYGFARYLEGVDLRTATRDDVSAWLRAHTRDPKDPADPRPWSVQTARRKLSALSQFYKWALDEGLIERDPTHRVELRRHRERKRPLRLSEEDVHRLFACVETRIQTTDERTSLLYILDAAILSLMYYFGLRVSEATNLRRSRVMYDEGEWVIEVVRKGDKVDRFPLTGAVYHAFARWDRLRTEIGSVPECIDFEFVHPWTGRKLSRKRAWLRIRRIAKEAGLAPQLVQRLSPHKLRHAIAYHMLERGETIAAVQALLGHSDVSTTGIYVSQDEEQRFATLRRASATAPTLSREGPPSQG